MTERDAFLQDIENELRQIRDASLWKNERVIASAQGARVRVRGGGNSDSDGDSDGDGDGEREVLNLCANNYLGLAADAELIRAAAAALEDHGLGMASVRFICGTSDLHRALEEALAEFLGGEDAVLYPSCFDANGGLFEPLLSEQDAVISDALNHASIIDGIRLCKARRFRYANRDLDALESCLREARDGGARRIIVATDGVFSMDGTFAPLAEMRVLADRFGAWLMVDDCHATGFVGARGAGTPSLAGVRVELLTGTLGKALGGAAGGYVVAASPVADLLRQRSRPYLFSNALPPAVVAAALAAVSRVAAADDLRRRLDDNAALWRDLLSRAGFSLLEGGHPIVPVMLMDAGKATALAAALWERGVYVTAFSFPVVPRGEARIRTQLSAALDRDDLIFAAEQFRDAAGSLGIFS
ncbi:MAG: glycine C-acetyltransferase [Alphaproteobacteria bacterium]|nr:glycine C-acetyltransferase [Alphaproteobacteria bacterium]MDA7988975.1 glycine C-acetyltransferase [Alphaproteobacteria bacterium]MDA8008970.1 glycine C-acetyltransferase [Alphaproteobacteria bacterium]